MKILLLGKNGQLGSEFQQLLPSLGETLCFDKNELDLCNTQALLQILNELKPDLIINASAYTAVDQAEIEQEMAMAVNTQAPGAIAEWAQISNAIFIHYSTDYVFNGNKNLPYTEADGTNPLNVYGKSKLAGEKAIAQAGNAYLILRTSWVYNMGGNGFPNKVLKWARKSSNLKIVDDQISNPTWACDLANATIRVLSSKQNNLFDFIQEKSGVYHLAGNGYTSRYKWAKQILVDDPNRTEQRIQSVEPSSSEEFPSPALRPLFTALNCTKFERTFGVKMPHWKTSLQKAMSNSNLDENCD